MHEEKITVDIRIREVTVSDASAVADLLNGIIDDGSYSAFDTHFSAEDERQYIEDFDPKGFFHVAFFPDNERIVGIQTLEPFAWYTHAFDHVAQIGTFIHLDFLGKGIGTRLSEYTFPLAKQSGFEKIFTFVREDNHQSLRFHLKLGFEIIGVAKKHAKIKDRYIDEILIEKFL
jgi:L-amino acid N-acyltransferase YncA